MSEHPVLSLYFSSLRRGLEPLGEDVYQADHNPGFQEVRSVAV